MPYTTLIPVQDLMSWRGERPVIVDCRFSLAAPERGRRDYVESHIPGAVYAHLDEDLSGPVIPGRTGRHPLPNPDTLARTFGRWGIGPGAQVVAYDDNGGGIAARLWWLLRWLGHEAAAVLDGGWQAWLAAGGPVREGVEQNPPATFTPRPRPELVLDAAAVEARRLDPDWRLLDARAEERYRGAREPIDPVAGRIPGARSAPWGDNLDAARRFLPPAQLAARYRALLGETPSEQVAVYCGSGVTACHDLLALAHAGLGEARLYAGSWSEWITGPERPVAREGIMEE